MKSHYIFLILLFAATSLAAQTSCPYYKTLIQGGDAAAAQEDYETAMNQYNAAILHCPAKAEEAQAKIIAVFKQIEKLKNDAKIQAEIAEKERQKADSALAQVRIQEAKNKKIIDASYFYGDRFGMAVRKWGDGMQYGFINKEGDTLINYKYSYAQPFDERTGFAIVKKKEGDKENLYLLDTFKVEYRMEYAPTDDNSVVALDLREMGYDSIPAKVFEMKQLKVLLLGRNKLHQIPQGMRSLANLECLDLGFNQITKLENLENLINLKNFNISGNYDKRVLITKLEGLENLKALQNFDISRNQITKLENLDNLKALQNFDISDNQITKLEKLDNLKALQTFDISGNKIAKLENLENLINLKNFNISGNYDIRGLITKLEGLENLKALQTFDISGNKIAKLENLDNLKALQNLRIDKDSIKEISHSFWESKVVIRGIYGENIDYIDWIKSCAKDSNYALALTIRKGIQNKNLDLNYGKFSWRLIFCHDFEGAIWAGEKYVEKGGKEIAYLSCLAMGYLYNGDYEKAYAIYSKYKNEKEGEEFGKDIFLRHLATVAAKNVPPKKPADVEKIKAFLGDYPFNMKILKDFFLSSLSDSTNYLVWLESCANKKDTVLAISIRKGIQNKNLDLNYGELSWQLIFCHDFEGGIWAGEKYAEKGDKAITYLSCLAINYLYNGDYEKAYAIYSKYKNEKEGEKFGKDIFLNHLEYLAAANIPPKKPADVEKIKAFLEAE